MTTMAACVWFESALREFLDSLSVRGFSITPKDEQVTALKMLIQNGDVMAVLPTGFGKSFIFQALVGVKERFLKKRVHVLVICPLMSIIEDQVLEAKSIGLSASSLHSAKLDDISNGKYQLLFASAEEVLDKRFLEILKGNNPFHHNMAALVVDESHTIETWTGRRSKKCKGEKKGSAFREAYGKLSLLRSCCREGTPIAALTGTADLNTQAVIEKELCLKPDCLKIYVSPNRSNLRFSVKKVKKTEQLQELDWLVTLLKENGIETPKTIIFCNTVNEIASVANYLFLRLGSHAYFIQDLKKEYFITIYHSNSWQRNKDMLVDSFKGNGSKRIVIASTALSMGVNFPDIRYIINWGPARSILDQHQEAGRAGRDGKMSHIIVIYHGQQISCCESKVKDFVRSSNCLRVAAYASLDSSVKPSVPPHDCCSTCAKTCMCKGDVCDVGILPFEKRNVQSGASSEHYSLTRNVSEEDRLDLRMALEEVLGQMQGEALLDPISAHGFSSELINDIVQNCENIFMIDSVTEKYPVFSVNNALKILEVVQEIFLDIPNLDDTIMFFHRENRNLISQRTEISLHDSDFDSGLDGFSDLNCS